MIYIGICDDEAEHMQRAKDLCNRFFSKRDIECECILFQSGDEVLKYTGENLLLLLLDIEMPGLNGLDVMERLQHNSAIWRIVFVSSHKQYVMDTFSLKTLGFLSKPVSYEALSKWLTIALQENMQKRSVTFEDNNLNGTINIEDIVYISAWGHYIEIHTCNNKTLTFVCDMKSAEDLLQNSEIIRIHKSYMVNLGYVTDISSSDVSLQSVKIKIPLGRTYKTFTQEKYNNYILDKAQRRLR